MTAVQRYKTLDGARVALIGEAARVYTPVVYIDSPVRLDKVPNGDVTLYCSDIGQGDRKLKPTARAMLSAGKRLGITKGAKKFLREVLK